MPARTTLDIPITIPSGDARKLVVFWGSDGGEFPTVTFDPAGLAIPMVRIESSVHPSGSLRAAAYILDTPAEGAKVLRFDTLSPVWSAVSAKVYQNARAGSAAVLSLAVTGTRIGEFLDELFMLDAFSETCDLVLGLGLPDGGLTPFAGQTAGADDVVNGSFLATTSDRTHAHNGEVEHGWTASASTDLLMIAVNVLFSSGQAVPSEVTPLSLWPLGEDVETVFVDSGGLSPLSLQLGSATPGIAPLLSGGAGAVSVQSSLLSALHVSPAWEVSAYWITVFCQPRSAPAINANRIILFKDAGSPAGGASIEQYNNGGTSQLRAYIRNSTGGVGTAIWIGAQTGQGAFALNVAHRIDMTFDGTTARLYLDRAEIASSSDAALTGFQGNVSTLEVASRNVGDTITAPFDGIIGQIEIQSGTPSGDTIAVAAAAVTVTDPLAPSPITANSEALQTVVEGSSNFVDVLANDTGKPAGHQFNFDFPTNPSSRLGIDQDGTASARVRITMPFPATTDRNESGTYRVRSRPVGGAYGNWSNQATIQWRQVGTGSGEEFEPFPFVVSVNPTVTHTGVTNRPGYSSSTPLSQQIVDPMSGIPIVRVRGNQGAVINTYPPASDGGPHVGGAVNSGRVWPLSLRNDNSSSAGRVWNADGSLLLLDQSRTGDGDASNAARSVLIDCTGFIAGAPYRVLLTATSGGLGKGSFWFWDPRNIRRAYVLNSNGSIDEWWPVGGSGHSVGEVNTISHLGPVSGYHTFNDFPAHTTTPSPDGQWFMAPCRSSSVNAADGHDMWGGRRRNLLTGALGPFIGTETPVFHFRDNNDSTGDRTAQAISPLGNYAHFHWSGQMKIVDALTSALKFDSHAGAFPGTGNFSHCDWVIVNGIEYLAGPVDDDGLYMVRASNGAIHRVSNANFANPSHFSGRNYKDIAETYGASGGVTSGYRYGIITQSNDRTGNTAGGRGFRLDPTSGVINICRFLYHHRNIRGAGGGYSSETNESEAHCNVAPDGRQVVFNSNWRVPGSAPSGNAGYQQDAYVAMIPEGWWRSSNNGL